MGQLKFRTQIILGFATILIFMVLAVLMTLQLILRDSYRLQESSILTANSRQVAINIDNRLDYYMSYLRILSSDKQLVHAMATQPFSKVREVLDATAAEYMNLNSARLNGIRIYRNGVYFQVDGLRNIRNIFAEFVPGNMTYRNNYLITGAYLNSRNEKVFSIFQKVYQTNSQREYFLEMCIYESELFGFFNEDDSGNHIAVFIGDQLLSFNDRKAFTRLLYRAQAEKRPGIHRGDISAMSKPISIQSSAKSGVDVVIETDATYLDRVYLVIVQRMALLIAGVAGLALVLVWQITRRLNLRMKNLSEKIQDISSWKLEHALSISGKDEFASLATELDETRKRILALIDQNIQTNELKRKAEIGALRAQINSHFLFNSLSSIKWLARLRYLDELSQAVDKLAVFLRYSLSFNENMVPLRSELEHLDAYIHLQKLRYGDELNVHVDIQEELLEAKTLKLLLQPFVENAIYHGRREDGTPLNVAIYSVVNEDTYDLVVEDDGNGMSPERIHRVLEEAPLEAGGYGLRNVISRLRACLLGKGELHIKSEPGVSTRIIVRQPLCAKEAE